MTAPTWWKVVGCAAIASLAIELVQLAVQVPLGGGHIADINDFISNTVGGADGYGVFVLVLRIPGVSPVIDRFRWFTDSNATSSSADPPGQARRSCSRPWAVNLQPDYVTRGLVAWRSDRSVVATGLWLGWGQVVRGGSGIQMCPSRTSSRVAN